MKAITKIGSAEFTEHEIEEIYRSGKYVCTHNGIYQVFRSQASDQYYGQKIIAHNGYALPGRFFIQTAAQINHVLGSKVLIEDMEE